MHGPQNVICMCVCMNVFVYIYIYIYICSAVSVLLSAIDLVCRPLLCIIGFHVSNGIVVEYTISEG